MVNFKVNARLPLLLALGWWLGLTGCTVVGEVAYDSASARERAACDAYPAMSDRQMCLQRLNAASRQAEAERKKP